MAGDVRVLFGFVADMIPRPPILSSKTTGSSESMRDLIRRLDRVYNACGGDEEMQTKQKLELEMLESMDLFDRTKFDTLKLLLQLGEKIRTLKDRRTNETTGYDRETIQLSNDVRKLLKRVRKDLTSLELLLQKQKKKAKKKDDKSAAQIVERRYALDTIEDNLVECERAFRKQFQQDAGESAPATGPARNTEKAELLRSTDQASTSLQSPLIDDDPFEDESSDFHFDDDHLQEMLQQFRHKEGQIDVGLDELSAGVQRLGEMALQLNNELQSQDIALNEVDNRIHRNLEQLESTNEKLKKTLEKVGGGERIIIIIVLMILAIVIIGALYFFVLK